MWHIIAIGYLFVTVLFAAAQPSIARALIYLLFWSVMPCLFAFWAAKTRRRNKLMKMQEDKAEDGAD
ncbi:hypothetical protein [Neisseria musculi]|uniref:Membrane protein n=1 Tax=Neisseria musculi TaxID=1815583 RepID=A0A7H1MEC7_9NEIS|nr:hypothetical protein [Neisseria musculi]QNT59992.1 putative membrane protein [Neisseria musculi]